jgi:Rieske Fe-S protein
MEVNKSTEKTISRRGLLCGAALVAVGLTTEMAESASAANGITQVGNKIKVDLTKNKGLAKVGGVVQINLSSGQAIALVRTAAGTKGLTAISLACTHMGAEVMQQGNTWVCPAHGSKFGIGGSLINGPARSALQKFPVVATATTATIG